MSIIAASGDTGPPVASRLGGDLWRRVVSALIMAAIALIAVGAGPLAFEVMVAAAAAVLSWEWMRLIGRGAFGGLGLLQVAVAVAVVVVTALGHPLIAIAAALIAAIALLWLAPGAGLEAARWLAAGPLYIGLPCVALVWLRTEWAAGETLILWLLATVWATDTGAYFAGRLIGGPRLAPRVSPNKTWAGLAGAVVSAALVGLLAARLDPSGPPASGLMLLGGMLAIVAQGGDLAESVVKRRFGAKDSSRLIPGHGGLLDRVDGLLAAAPALALWQWLTRGEMLSWG